MTLNDLNVNLLLCRLCYAYCDLTADARITLFLQRGRIACNEERCNTYGNFVRPSVCLSHAGTLSRRMKTESRGLHYELHSMK